MKEIKVSLSPDRPLDSTQPSDREANDERLNPSCTNAEPLPESSRPRKDGPGGE